MAVEIRVCSGRSEKNVVSALLIPKLFAGVEVQGHSSSSAPNLSDYGCV